MHGLLTDVRCTARVLVKSPLATGIAVMALALGIGANATTLSGVVCLVLRPYPFPASQRIVRLEHSDLRHGGGFNVVSSAEFVAWRELNASFERVAAYESVRGSIGRVSDPERVEGRAVSAGFFELLGVTPALGRVFTPEEERAGRESVVLLSDSLWRRRFGGDPGVLGRTLTIDGHVFTIAGVMPRDFDFPGGAECWAPLTVGAREREWTRARTWLVLARLKPGVSLEQARAEMDLLATRLAGEHPETNEGLGIRILRLGELPGSLVDRFVMIGLGASLFVLLLACVNVSNLLLARATTRQHEMAVRAAVGASRSSLARLFVLEALMLSMSGTVAGVLLGVWALHLSKAAVPAQVFKLVPGLKTMHVDATVLSLTAALALAVGLACGLVTAWRATRQEALVTGLGAGGRAHVLGQGRLRQALVVAEVSLAIVLLVAAGVMVQSYARLAEFDIGMNPRNVLQMSVGLPSDRYSWAATRRYADEAMERLEALPGVAVAGAGNVSGGVAMEELRVAGQPPAPRGTRAPRFHLVTCDYFAAVGLPVVRGRGFTREDELGEGAAVAVVSESVVRRHWQAGSDPLGGYVTIGGYGLPPLRVVGVVRDFQDWFSRDPQPTVYVLNALMPQQGLQIFVRTSGGPAGLAATVRSEVQGLDPALAIEGFRTMERDLWELASGVRHSVAQMLAFAGIALLLATTGIYGVVSFSVAQRTREIGVRMALGARAADVLWLVIGQSLRTTALGVGLGLVAAFLLMRLLERALSGAVVVNMAVFAGVALGLTACAVLAAYAPARRAARVDPNVALRAE